MENHARSRRARAEDSIKNMADIQATVTVKDFDPEGPPRVENPKIVPNPFWIRSVSMLSQQMACVMNHQTSLVSAFLGLILEIYPEISSIIIELQSDYFCALSVEPVATGPNWFKPNV